MVTLLVVMATVVIIIVVVAFAGLLAVFLARAFFAAGRHVFCLAVDKFVELTAVEPYAPASGAVVNLYALARGDFE